MTKGAALFSFWNRFSTAYPTTSVPEDTIFPWLTYEPVFDTWDGQVSMRVDLWYRTESEAEPNAKVQEISETIGLGGVLLPCEDGYIWLKRGSPWCANLGDDADPMIKRRSLNVTAEYLTTN